MCSDTLIIRGISVNNYWCKLYLRFLSSRYYSNEDYYFYTLIAANKMMKY